MITNDLGLERHMAHGQRTPKYGSDIGSEHAQYLWTQCHHSGFTVQSLIVEGCYDEMFL